VLTELKRDALIERSAGLADREVLFVMLGVRIVLVLLREAEEESDALNDGAIVNDADRSGAESDPVDLADRLTLPEDVRLCGADGDALRVDVLRL
jgi:hypothetical protein